MTNMLSREPSNTYMTSRHACFSAHARYLAHANTPATANRWGHWSMLTNCMTSAPTEVARVAPARNGQLMHRIDAHASRINQISRIDQINVVFEDTQQKHQYMAPADTERITTSTSDRHCGCLVQILCEFYHIYYNRLHTLSVAIQTGWSTWVACCSLPMRLCHTSVAITTPW